jgi:hypothetical protein
MSRDHSVVLNFLPVMSSVCYITLDLFIVYTLLKYYCCLIVSVSCLINAVGVKRKRYLDHRHRWKISNNSYTYERVCLLPPRIRIFVCVCE